MTAGPECSRPSAARQQFACPGMSTSHQPPEGTTLMLKPAFALVSMNMTLNSRALASPSSMETCLHTIACSSAQSGPVPHEQAGEATFKPPYAGHAPEELQLEGKAGLNGIRLHNRQHAPAAIHSILGLMHTVPAFNLRKPCSARPFAGTFHFRKAADVQATVQLKGWQEADTKRLEMRDSGLQTATACIMYQPLRHADACHSS